jgi:hypothetical protein
MISWKLRGVSTAWPIISLGKSAFSIGNSRDRVNASAADRVYHPRAALLHLNPT